MRYVLGVDIGTTSLKAAVFDELGNQVRLTSRDYTLQVEGDRVEFDPREYWRLFLSAYEEVTQGLEIAALSVDTQCETLILADEAGQPLANAIVWLDNRAAAQADAIRQHFGNQRVYQVTGQPEITATWPAAKLLWVKQNQPQLFARAKKVFLLEDYILFCLTGAFVTEKTLQSSSLYFDITTGTWWQEMLDFIGLPQACLPRLCDSCTPVGQFRGAAVVTGAMDQIAGAVGAGVFGADTVSEMTGTTMAVFAPGDTVPPYDPASIVPCHYNFNGRYCTLSWTSTAGIALKWFKNQFCESFSFRQLDEMAAAVAPGCNGLTFLPYLCGSTMPKYDPDARGAFLGLTMEHTRAHAVRAILESVACMLNELLLYMRTDCQEVRSMGGGATSPLWCQIKADLTQKRIVTLKNKETACLGSAILAGVGVGIWPDVASACAQAVAVDKVYQPQPVDYSACWQNYLAAQKKIL